MAKQYVVGSKYKLIGEEQVTGGTSVRYKPTRRPKEQSGTTRARLIGTPHSHPPYPISGSGVTEQAAGPSSADKSRFGRFWEVNSPGVRAYVSEGGWMYQYTANSSVRVEALFIPRWNAPVGGALGGGGALPLPTPQVIPLAWFRRGLSIHRTRARKFCALHLAATLGLAAGLLECGSIKTLPEPNSQVVPATPHRTLRRARNIRRLQSVSATGRQRRVGAQVGPVRLHRPRTRASRWTTSGIAEGWKKWLPKSLSSLSVHIEARGLG